QSYATSRGISKCRRGITGISTRHGCRATLVAAAVAPSTSSRIRYGDGDFWAFTLPTVNAPQRWLRHARGLVHPFSFTCDWIRTTGRWRAHDDIIVYRQMRVGQLIFVGKQI